MNPEFAQGAAGFGSQGREQEARGGGAQGETSLGAVCSGLSFPVRGAGAGKETRGPGFHSRAPKGCRSFRGHYGLSGRAAGALTWPRTRVARLSPFPSGAAVGRSHSRPEAPPTPRPGPERRAAALGPGGRGLRRGLGGRSGADPGSGLPAPCEGLGAAGAGAPGRR